MREKPSSSMDVNERQHSADSAPDESGGISRDLRELEYIKAVMSVAGDDVRQVYLRVTGVVGLAVLFATQLPFARLVELSTLGKVLLGSGLTSAGCAAALFFLYLSRMHISRLQMAARIRDLDADGVYEQWHGRGEFWTRYRWMYFLGNSLFGLSVVLLGVVFGLLIA